MGITRVTGRNIKDASVGRSDLITATTTEAVITKAIAGTGVSISSTGVDAGTGDVTINATSPANGYLSNFNAEVDTSSWSNSGANFTISRTTTSGEFLKDTASFKFTANGSQAVNDYISSSFSLGLGDRSRLLSVKFYFKGISNYDSGDCHVVFHDGTSEIIPSITSIPGGSGYFQATWVSTSASSYTIRFKAKVTTAFSISVDEVYVGPLEVVAGGTIAVAARITGSPANASANNPIIWPTVSYDTHSAYNATTGEFTAPVSGHYQVDGYINVATTGNQIASYIDGSFDAWLGYNHTDGVTDFSGQVRLNAGQILTIRSDQSITTFTSTGNLSISGYFSGAIVQNSRVEYVSNSSTNDGNDTSSFASGILGSTIPALTATYKKRVKFTTPITQADEIIIQADWDGVGQWQLWTSWHDDTYGTFGPTWEYVSNTEIDIWMRGDVYARRRESDATSRTYTNENSAGSKWRVRKSANPLAVESPNIVEAVTIRHEETSGTAGGTPTADAWTKATLNTLDNPKGYSWVSLSGDVITLAAGAYRITATKEIYAVGLAKLRVRNTTDSTNIVNGHSTYHSGNTTDAGGVITGTNFVVTTKTTANELQYYVDVATTNGLGLATSSGIAEVYATVLIERYGAS